MVKFPYKISITTLQPILLARKVASIHLSPISALLCTKRKPFDPEWQFQLAARCGSTSSVYQQVVGHWWFPSPKINLRFSIRTHLVWSCWEPKCTKRFGIENLLFKFLFLARKVFSLRYLSNKSAQIADLQTTYHMGEQLNSKVGKTVGCIMANWTLGSLSFRLTLVVLHFSHGKRLSQSGGYCGYSPNCQRNHRMWEARQAPLHRTDERKWRSTKNGKANGPSVALIDYRYPSLSIIA